MQRITAQFLLLLVCVTTAPACRGQDVPHGGLKVTFAGTPVAEAERIVVLLHGYAAAGDDLSYFAQRMKALSRRERTAFVFPHGTVNIESGGRAWTSGKPGEFEHAREQIVALLTNLKKGNPGARLTVGGFSQGAMLSSNLLFDPQLDLESVLLYSPPNNLRASDGNLRASDGQRQQSRTRVFLSHGKRDKVVPFDGAVELRDQLRRLGFDVEWSPFDGPHHITGEQIQAAERFLLRASN